MAMFYLIGAPEGAEALDVPDGVSIAPAESDMLESDFTITVDTIEGLLSFATAQRLGVDIAPYADGADDMGVEGTLSFYALDEADAETAAAEESI